MADRPTPESAAAASQPAALGRLLAIVLGLTGLVVLMLCAFALPSVHGGPHQVPIGVTGPSAAAQQLQERLDGDEWDVTVYESPGGLTSAVEDREIAGGMALAPEGVDVYTASADASTAGSELTALADSIAAKQQATATAHDLVSYPEDDPRGAGFAAAGLPMIFGGIFPAVVLTRLFPGHAGLRMRVTGVVLFSLLAGAAVAAFLQYGTGSLVGDYLLTSLGIALGMAALAMTFIGLEALLGMAGLGIGAAVMMLLGNPLSGLGTGPYWLPSGWAALGQLLPPGASGSLLRANAFFDGTGAGGPGLVLAVWVVLGLILIVIADRRGLRTKRTGAGHQEPEPGTA